MDYPQLNLLFGLGLILTLAINVSLHRLLSKIDIPRWRSILSWVVLILSILSALYIEILFLQRMTPAFNRQIFLGFLLIGIVVALVTGFFYRREIPPRAAGFLFGVQMLVSLICLVLAFGLYRSLIPILGV